MDPLGAAHLVRRRLEEAVYYPDHAPRRESAAYARTHHELVVAQDRGCMVCGVRHSTLGDAAANRVGARALETHHWYVEWALRDAVDLAKFNARIVARLRERHPGSPKYDHDFSREEMLAWTDADEHALVVLCDVHHRHALVGIHAVTQPIWAVQDLLRDDFSLTVAAAPNVPTEGVAPPATPAPPA